MFLPVSPADKGSIYSSQFLMRGLFPSCFRLKSYHLLMLHMLGMFVVNKISPEAILRFKILGIKNLILH